MKRNIIILGILALVSFWFPTFASAEDDGTHAADVTSDDWGDDGDVDLNFDFEGSTTGVKEIAASGSSLRVGVEGGDLIVWSADNSLLPIFNLRGVAVAVVKIQAGRNVIEVPAHGVLVVAGKKVMI